MPHLFTNRQRLHNLSEDKKNVNNQFKWEAVNAVVYLIGGVLFIFGSILFLPGFSKYSNIGVWIFIIGSLLYLLVTGHDFLESICYRRSKVKKTFWDNIEFCAAVIYLIGTVLFLIGSLFFLSQVDAIKAGSYCFILGSILFFVGALINVLQITQTRSILIMQLQNATAVTFMVGSAIFAFGSVPYLWQHLDKADQTLLFTLVGWEFIIGSMLFLFGGIFNFYRAYLVMHHYR